MPCRNGVCWKRGKRPPAGANIPVQGAPVPATRQPITQPLSPQIAQFGQQAPNNLPVAQDQNNVPIPQGSSMAAPPPIYQAPIPGSDKSILQRGKEFFTGSPEQALFFPTMSPQQEQLQAQIMQILGPLLGRLGQQAGQSGFAPIAQEELRRFHTETVPTLAERFTALGGGAQRSSGFQSALSRGAQALGSQLGALGAQYGLKERALNQGLATNLLSPSFLPQFQSLYQQGSPSGFTQAAPALAQLAATLATAFI